MTLLPPGNGRPVIPDIEPAQLRRACDGDLDALGAILTSIQPGVYNLAVRMLGNREDAHDACQEILVRVTTHLTTFRGDAAFGTWVFRVARNHLSTVAARARRRRETSLEELQEKLAAGLELGHRLRASAGDDPVLTPADKAEAGELALSCTQGMLLGLDPDLRLAYVLDVIFGLPSQQAADVLEITPAAYRKRLSRARSRLHDFMHHHCGLANASAPCRCDRQLPAARLARAAAGDAERTGPITPKRPDADSAAYFTQLVSMSDAAEVFRSQPEYAAPASMVAAIRSTLRHRGWM